MTSLLLALTLIGCGIASAMACLVWDLIIKRQKLRHNWYLGLLPAAAALAMLLCLAILLKNHFSSPSY